MPPIAAERLASGTLLVAEIERTPAGFALTQLLDGALYLANISVSPRAARRGIGAALLQGVVADAARRHANAVTLTTFREPRWNGPWFRKHNFTEMPAAEIGPGLDAVLKRHASFLDMTWRETLGCLTITNALASDVFSALG
jgi:N-acetylglutamate synthase-like GNAT family acetyltransferase